MSKLFIGTSGFNYKDWRTIFYPKGLPENRWLAFYAQRFNTVEVNATFYRHFARDVLVKWRDSTHDDFCFTLKGPRTITHVKRLQDINAELGRFLDSAQGLQQKLSVILWQFPPSFKYETMHERLAEFLALLPIGIRQAFEFRDKSWFKDELYALLNRHNAGFVINDSSRFPATEAVTGDFMYVRFHGPGRLYASSYSTEQLSTWADKIRSRLDSHDVYCYFNNDFGGRALRNAVELRDLIVARRDEESALH
jgi:uncharacterized protein YecE (DUF72 family)